jgi:hypothetical protein
MTTAAGHRAAISCLEDGGVGG